MNTGNQTGNEAGSPGMTCYALRLFTYDYYEWEEVHAVSFDPKLLRAHFEEMDHLYADRPLVDGSEHAAHADREDPHWTIEPVTFLHNVKEHAPGAVEGRSE